MKNSDSRRSSTVTPSVKGSPSSRWELYDQLIALIPEDLVVQDALVGLHWTLVRSAGVGMAMTPPDGFRLLPSGGGFKGRKLRELAGLAKSWHPLEAALGVAAINSYVNAPSTIGKQWKIQPQTQANQSVFITMKSELAGKKVTVVGHFPDLDELASVCRLSILERNPQEGDFPDPACEYILEDQDYLFMTGVTLINKTLPRLVELGHNARIVLVGPSVPLTPLWFSKGVASLAGTTVIDAEGVWRHVAQAGDKSVFEKGAHKIKLYPADAR
jgi:uncharacterized protein (DUF4213/DUF364 family)